MPPSSDYNAELLALEEKARGAFSVSSGRRDSLILWLERRDRTPALTRWLERRDRGTPRKVGETKTVGEKTYVFNKNRRWELADKAQRKAAKTAKQKELEAGLTDDGKALLEKLKAAMGGKSEESAESQPKKEQPPKASFRSMDGSNESDAKAIQSQMKTWKAESDRLMGQAKETHQDNNQIVSTINEEVARNPKRARAVVDKDGNVQASSIVADAGDSMYIEFLATAPWNVQGGDKRSTKGAGSQMIEDIIVESLKKGKKGKVTLTALPDAVEFYKKIGFTAKADSLFEDMPDMELTPEAAQSFLSKRGRKLDAADAEDFNAELLALEEKALGAFAAPRKRADSLSRWLESRDRS